ncbi:Ribosomal silencing factor RsfS [Candidatus Xenohaliotis californiensis]|uniref:Ribosomal silencing factor RsfS n=2 Tax=Candidatus Xenohaliotis californiensis TaxID=84677 RepID=A0ABM9N8M5_9RICK|nr:Ribosomal silencing factor RsfS [Candidatus Xenohaliotis californiensis]
MLKSADDNNILQLIYSILSNRKLEKISIIDLNGMDVLYKHVVIATALSKRHVKTSAEFLIKELKVNDIYMVNLSGIDKDDWVMIDFNSVVVHIFIEEVRAFYDLDSMWIEEEGCQLLN